MELRLLDLWVFDHRGKQSVFNIVIVLECSGMRLLGQQEKCILCEIGMRSLQLKPYRLR